MDRSQQDRDLCERLIREDPSAVADFGIRFDEQLEAAKMSVSQQLLDWRCDWPGLLNPLAVNVATGYLDACQREPRDLDSFVLSLCLSDLMLVSTCLQGDDSASRFLIEIIETRVRPSLLRNWGGRVGRVQLEDVIQDLCSHCLTKAIKGTSSGKTRLGTYRGRSSLFTWLHAIAVKMLMDRVRCRRDDSITADINESLSSPVASQPDVQAQIGEATSRGDDFRTRLVLLLRGVLDAMPARRRLAAALHWVHGHRASEVADRMQVSRPRVTELLSEAERDVKNATRQICEEIAQDSDRPVGEIVNLLTEQIPHILGEPASE